MCHAWLPGLDLMPRLTRHPRFGGYFVEQVTPDNAKVFEAGDRLLAINRSEATKKKMEKKKEGSKIEKQRHAQYLFFSCFFFVYIASPFLCSFVQTRLAARG